MSSSTTSSTASSATSARSPATERLVRLHAERFGAPPADIREVAGDGSARSYLRLVDGEGSTVIGGIGPDLEENDAYLAFSRSFREIGLPVPEIFAEDREAGVWLETDLGDTTLFDHLEAERVLSAPTPPGASDGAASPAEADGPDPTRFPPSVVDVYRRVVEQLPRFQIEGHRVVDYDLAYPREAFDRQSMLWDLNYFKYHFLKLDHIPFNEARLERDFERLVEFLLRADLDHFLYRDFQSRNVMLRDGDPWFIDYQGGRRGAPHYDIASLLYDAKADMPEETREELLVHYLDAREEHGPVDREGFRELYGGYVLIRIMQALGAYGYRGFFERKPRFLQSVPYAARNLERLLDRGLPVDLPEIEAAFGRIVEDWAHRTVEPDPEDRLTVRIGSFSYRGGYPEDVSGHGGGFVFDCRALPNPGREAEYRAMSGFDPEVIEYLEGRPEPEAFWEGIRQLVDAQVAEYLRRDFTSLSVHFGCTGGQHRSVYLAERLRRHLERRFPGVRVLVSHREEGTWPAEAASAVNPREA